VLPLHHLHTPLQCRQEAIRSLFMVQSGGQLDSRECVRVTNGNQPLSTHFSVWSKQSQRFEVVLVD